MSISCLLSIIVDFVDNRRFCLFHFFFVLKIECLFLFIADNLCHEIAQEKKARQSVQHKLKGIENFGLISVLFYI